MALASGPEILTRPGLDLRMNHHSIMNGPESPNLSSEAPDHSHCRLNPLTGEWVLVSPPAGENPRPMKRLVCRSRGHGPAGSEMSIRRLPPMVDARSLETSSERLRDAIEIEDRFQRRYFRTHGAAILHAYVIMELDHGERVVAENDTWVALVPFWARAPFEILVVPRRRVSRLRDLTVTERDGSAELLERISAGYDGLFGGAFPPAFDWHGAPVRLGHARHWQLHGHLYPPPSGGGHSSGDTIPEEAVGNVTPEAAAALFRDSIASESRRPRAAKESRPKRVRPSGRSPPDRRPQHHS